MRAVTLFSPCLAEYYIGRTGAHSADRGATGARPGREPLSAGVSARHSATPLAGFGSSMLPAARWWLNAETLPTTGRTAVAYVPKGKGNDRTSSYAKVVRP